ECSASARAGTRTSTFWWIACPAASRARSGAPGAGCAPNMRNVSRNNRRRRAMTTHITGTRDEWLAARIALLAEEKELTRRSDALARRRQELPWVRVDKEYRFETEKGSGSLTDLFQGRSQLLIYHFMFGPDYKAG